METTVAGKIEEETVDELEKQFQAMKTTVAGKIEEETVDELEKQFQTSRMLCNSCKYNL